MGAAPPWGPSCAEAVAPIPDTSIVASAQATTNFESCRNQTISVISAPIEA